MSNPRAVRPAAPVPAALIFRKSRRVTCGTQFSAGTVLQATKRQRTNPERVCQSIFVALIFPLGGGQGGGSDTVGDEMNAWFEALGRRFAEAARDRGATVAAPELDPQVADEVLELARVAAHTKERRFAPLACFMAGIAVERLRQSGSLSAADEAAYLRGIHEWLEAQPEPSD